MLKGHTKIELTDEQGSTQTVEHDNLVTNAVTDMFRAYMGDQALILKHVSNADKFAEFIFGGIMLFSTQLTGDATDYGFNNSDVVGYSDDAAYSGDNTYRGSFNTVESGLQDDGSYKMVFDFSTSQANGSIAAVGLVPLPFAKIGCGNTGDVVSDYFSYFPSPIAPFNTNGYFLPNDYNVNPVCIVGDYVYCVRKDEISTVKTTGIITLYKYDLGISSISLSDTVGGARFINSVNINVPSSVTEFITSGSSSYPVDLNYDSVTNELFIWPTYHSAITAKETMPYCSYNLTTGEVKSYTFTNNATECIGATTNSNCNRRPIYSQQTARCGRIFIWHDYIIFGTGISTSCKFYVCSANDNTDIKQILYDDGSEFKSIRTDGYGALISPIHKNEKVFMVHYPVCAINMATGKAKEGNYKVFNGPPNPIAVNSIMSANVGPYLTFKPFLNPYVMCTKNNLDEAVTKTASQTMKITYTLTETAEG